MGLAQGFMAGRGSFSRGAARGAGVALGIRSAALQDRLAGLEERRTGLLEAEERRRVDRHPLEMTALELANRQATAAASSEEAIAKILGEVDGEIAKVKGELEPILAEARQRFAAMLDSTGAAAAMTEQEKLGYGNLFADRISRGFTDQEALDEVAASAEAALAQQPQRALVDAGLAPIFQDEFGNAVFADGATRNATQTASQQKGAEELAALSDELFGLEQQQQGFLGDVPQAPAVPALEGLGVLRDVGRGLGSLGAASFSGARAAGLFAQTELEKFLFGLSPDEAVRRRAAIRSALQTRNAALGLEP